MKVKRVVDGAGNPYGYRFNCPGCTVGRMGGMHVLPTVPGHHAMWRFNGDVDKPSFSPSILSRSGHYIRGRQEDGCWCDRPHPHFKCGICHSFVRDGQIEYLSDCTHPLAGQTIALPDIEDD